MDATRFACGGVMRPGGFAAETARQTLRNGAIAENLPRWTISRGELEGGISVLAGVCQGGLVASNGEAGRRSRSAVLECKRCRGQSDEKMVLTLANPAGGGIKLGRLAKKRQVCSEPALGGIRSKTTAPSGRKKSASMIAMRTKCREREIRDRAAASRTPSWLALNVSRAVLLPL